MALTFTVGTGAAVAAGVAAAAAGAVGLGLLGAAALSRRGGGRFGRRGGRNRFGRQAQKQVEESNALERALDLIRQQDVTGCGMRLVCELAGLREENLTEEEKAILDIVEPRPKAGEGVLPSSSGAVDYKIAKELGHRHADCSLTFPLCSFNGTQLMNIVDGYLP
ncbi:uncharacterized protein [Macrobrachium rosenbergii]|uniref:uncharacterized protein n=1 Tax=Macrobrachium rosenbergii TaxID=79674 RepID=UPI0034D3A24D